MAILILFLWLRPALPVSEGLEQVSGQLFLPVVQAPLLPVRPTAELTESQNPTPVPSPTRIVADTAVPAAVSELTRLPINTTILQTPSAVSLVSAQNIKACGTLLQRATRPAGVPIREEGTIVFALPILN